MPRKKVLFTAATETVPATSPVQAAQVPQTLQVSELAAALTNAIEIARPTKKNSITRAEHTPWTPPKGARKLKLTRKFYQHGLLIQEDFLSNTEIDLINKVRPGQYCGGFVRLNKRRDKGIDLDYPVKERSQSMKLVSQFGLRNMTEILQRCLDEANMPKSPNSDTDD